MKLLVSGASGFIGKQLYSYLAQQGHTCFRLVRSKPKNPHEIFWDPYHKIINTDAIKDIDVYIHLSGANIADSFWTTKRKKILIESRVITTEFLSTTIANLNNPQKRLFIASAIGYYGTNPPLKADESTSKGTGFLSDLCYQWEKSAQSTVEMGVRTVFMRFGMVMGGAGGLLKKLIRIYKWGLGGIMGDKNAYISWIAIEDLCSAVNFLLSKEDAQGPFNFVTPNPITQAELTYYLSRTLKRPAFFHIPSCIFKWGLGEMGRELFSTSQYIYPSRLLKEGFNFSFPHFSNYIEFLHDRKML